MIMLTNPPTTDKNLTNSTTPVLMPYQPAIAINDNYNLLSRHIIIESIDLNGFIIEKYTVQVQSFQVKNTKCQGNLCNRQQDDIVKCACYQMTNHNTNVVISLDIQVTLEYGNSFQTTICSKWF